jgi:hypothetical protein
MTQLKFSAWLVNSARGSGQVSTLTLILIFSFANVILFLIKKFFTWEVDQQGGDGCHSICCWLNGHCSNTKPEKNILPIKKYNKKVSINFHRSVGLCSNKL